MATTNPLEQPSADDENSACIGATTDPPESTLVQADAEQGPEADQVYGRRWS
jgi:hypothetical protein